MKIILIFLLFVFAIAKENNIKINNDSSKNDNNNIKIQNNIKINQLKENLKSINLELENNIWIKKYSNYILYKEISSDIEEMRAKAHRWKNWKDKKFRKKAKNLFEQIKIKEKELSLIEEYKDSPIGHSINPKPIDKAPDVTNPINIIEALSYINTIIKQVKEYDNINNEIVEVLSLLNDKQDILKQLYNLTKDKNIKQELKQNKKILDDFINVLNVVSTTNNVYKQKTEQVIFETKHKVKLEIEKALKIVITIVILYLILFIIKKIITRKYRKKFENEDDNFKKNNDYYVIHKVLNFIFIILIFLILLFSYISNASYLVTFLGFASAGIAIALKDWFMSIFGWLVITTSGSIKLGDRIKVVKNGVEVVGDVMDISLFKIAVREDVTLTSYKVNRRTGRVFFIPNNYIFTDMIANYTYEDLKSVWDGVDIVITFDSNHKKAVSIAKEIVHNNAKHMTDVTNKDIKKMKTKYVFRNSNPNPRVYAFVETYGIVISCWYHVVSYATLGARSKVGTEILDAFKKEDDIKIAYPTQNINLSKEILYEEM